MNSLATSAGSALTQGVPLITVQYRLVKCCELRSADWDEIFTMCLPYFECVADLLEFSKSRNTHAILALDSHKKICGVSFFRQSASEFRPHFLGLTMAAKEMPPMQTFLQIRRLKSVLKKLGGSERWVWGRTADPIILEFASRVFREFRPRPDQVSLDPQSRLVLETVVPQGLSSFHMPSSAKHYYSGTHITAMNKRRKTAYAQLFERCSFSHTNGDRLLFVGKI